jgi:PadR family transcriptional regulator PadR
MYSIVPMNTNNDVLINQSAVQMRKGLLVYCVLLLCKDGKVYSSDIIVQLRQAELIVVEGTPRKYYWLTSEGLEILKALQKAYHSLHTSVAQLEKGTI